MIENIIIDYLNNALSVSVYAEVPENRPDSYVVIEKTGGGSENKIKSALVAIQSIAPTLYGAATLNESVIEAMSELERTADVFSCELNSDYNFTNPQTKEYRYQAVFQIYY